MTLNLNSTHTELGSCVKVEVTVLGCPSLIVRKGLCGRKLNLNSEPRSCVKVEVAVLGPPTLIRVMVSVDVKRQ